MKFKQKKLNPWSDMSFLSKRLDFEEIERLQKSRLFKSEKPRKEAFYQTEPVESPDLKEMVSEGQSQPISSAVISGKTSGEKVFKADKIFTRFASIFLGSNREKIVKEINLLPRIENKGFSARFHFRPSSIKFISGYLSIALILMSVFPLLDYLERARNAKTQVLGAVNTAYSDLQDAKQKIIAADFEKAGESLGKAYTGFESASREFESLGLLASRLPQVSEGEKLVRAAQQATLGLQYFNSALNSWLQLRIGPEGFSSPETRDIKSSLRAGFDQFAVAEQYLKDTAAMLGELRLESFPADVRAKIVSAGNMVSNLLPGIKDFSRLQSLAEIFLAEGRKTYLLLFQNSRELRATGGFIGTYGLATFDSGKLIDLKIESVYNPDGQLKDSITPPGPLQRILTKQWAMRDSNWFFNFPDSAAAALNFLKLETGVSADGVIAFTPRVFERLLSLAGPVPMPEYGEVLDAENFTDIVQRQTSVVYDRKLNQPKKFLSDFAPRLLKRISEMDVSGWISSMQVFFSSLNEKDILLYSNENRPREELSRLSWDGGIVKQPGDYLAVVNSNVGAGKTDQDTGQAITLKTKIAADGSQTNYLTVKRSHKSGREKDFPINVDFMRVYVPAGSELVSASGFDGVPFYPSSYADQASDPVLKIWGESTLLKPSGNVQIISEGGKTVFAGWVILSPEQEREITLVYHVPAPNAVSQVGFYSLYLQKQPGAPLTSFSGTVELPSGLRTVWTSSSAKKADGNSYVFQTSLARDESWGLIFK